MESRKSRLKLVVEMFAPKRYPEQILRYQEMGNEKLGFIKKKYKVEESTRRRWRCRVKKLPVVFPVVQKVSSGHGGEEWPAKVRTRWRRKLRHCGKEIRSARKGVEFRLNSCTSPLFLNCGIIVLTLHSSGILRNLKMTLKSLVNQ